MHCLAGVRGYLKRLAVVIAKFKSLDKKIHTCLRREKSSMLDSSYFIFSNSSSKIVDIGAVN